MMNAELPEDQWRRKPAPTTAAKRDSKIPFRALMVFTFILLIAPQTFFPALASMRVAMIAALIAVLSYSLDRFIRRRSLVEFSRETFLVICLLGWTVLTIPLSYWPGGSVSYLLNIYAKTLIIFWLLSHVVNTMPRLRFVAWGLSLMSVPLAICAVINLASGNFTEHGLAADEARILGYDAPLTGNPNDLALTLNLILPLSVSLFLAGGKRWVRGLLLACICLGVIGVISTFSRGGFLTLAVIFIVYLVKLMQRPRERQWAFLALFFALAVIPFLPEGYIDRLSTITDIESDASGSAQARWSDTVAAIEYVMFHPLVGAGLGMDTLALNEVRGPVWKEIHNVYLQYAMDLGIPGLILFVMLLRGTLRSTRLAEYIGLQRQRDPATAGLFHLAEGIRISLYAFAVAALFHPVGYHFYFYYFAGLAIAARMIATRSGPEPVMATATVSTPIRRFS
jgi:putative inorganic carbon (HCO3(-)) transporter